MRRTICCLACAGLLLGAAASAATAPPEDPPPGCAAANYAFGMNLGYIMYGLEYAAQGGVSPTPDQLAALQRGHLQLAAMADMLRTWQADRAVSRCSVVQGPDISTLIALNLDPPRTAAEAASALVELSGVERHIGLALRSEAGTVGGAAAGAVLGAGVGPPHPASWIAGGLLGAVIGRAAAQTAADAIAPQGSDPLRDIVGTWQWFNGAIVAVSPGGGLSSSLGFSGSWRCTDSAARTFDFDWTRGPTGPWYDKLRLSPDGKSLAGSNQADNGVSATKIR